MSKKQTDSIGSSNQRYKGGFWTNENDERLRRLVANGLSSTQIAVEMGVTRNTILGYIHRNKIELARRKSNDPMNDVKVTPYVRKKKNKPATNPISATLARTNQGKEGNNHFNVRRMLELSAEPATMPKWPKDENELSVHFMDTKDPHCRMPLWGTADRIGKVCGKVRIGTTKNGVYVPLSPYCSSCHPLVYTPQVPRFRRRTPR